MMHDLTKIALFAGGGFTLVGFFFLAWVVSENGTSRNLALGIATLFASALFLAIQFYFELRGSESNDVATAELVVDRAMPRVGEWKYDLSQTTRFRMESEANKLFAVENPGQFNGDREKLTSDMILFSIIAFLANEEFDWQINKVRFRGRGSTITRVAGGSKPEDCTPIGKKEIQASLSKVGNYFANANMFFGDRKLCLPPGATLSVTQEAVVLKTPFCEISFTLESGGAVAFINPDTRSASAQLPNGAGAQLESRMTNIKIDTRYDWTRAQSIQMPKYRDWSDRLASGVHAWFEGLPNQDANSPFISGH
jgi:hypothetical protein